MSSDSNEISIESTYEKLAEAVGSLKATQVESISLAALSYKKPKFFRDLHTFVQKNGLTPELAGKLARAMQTQNLTYVKAFGVPSPQDVLARVGKEPSMAQSIVEEFAARVKKNEINPQQVLIDAYREERIIPWSVLVSSTRGLSYEQRPIKSGGLLVTVYDLITGSLGSMGPGMQPEHYEFLDLIDRRKIGNFLGFVKDIGQKNYVIASISLQGKDLFDQPISSINYSHPSISCTLQTTGPVDMSVLEKKLAK